MCSRCRCAIVLNVFLNLKCNARPRLVPDFVCAAWVQLDWALRHFACSFWSFECSLCSDGQPLTSHRPIASNCKALPESTIFRTFRRSLGTLLSPQREPAEKSKEKWAFLLHSLSMHLHQNSRSFQVAFKVHKCGEKWQLSTLFQ